MKTKKEYQKPTMGIVHYPSKPLLQGLSKDPESRSSDFHNWDNE